MFGLNLSRNLGCLLALVLWTTACPKPTTQKTDGGGDVEECIENSDCPDSQLFYCNTKVSPSRCEPSCYNKADCTAEVRGEFALDYCAGNLGCQCDEGRCVGALCSSDLDCGSQVCRNGACVDAPSTSTVTSCRITPELVVLTPGARAKFWISTWAGNEPVVLKNGVTWTSSNSVVTGGGTGMTQEFTANAPSARIDAVTATVDGGVSCKAQAVVLPLPSAANKVNAVVLDELSGWPIANATVLLSSKDGGALDEVQTNESGFAELTVPSGNNQVSVSVFHTDFNYLTIANYALSGQATRFLSLIVRRNQTDKYGGYKGGFKNVFSSDVQVGIAGASLAGAITDLSLDQLLGPTVPKDIVIGTINQKDVPIPAGVYLGLPDKKIKDTVSAQGLAGVCYSNGSVDETKIEAGTCGTRTAWALSGNISIGELPIDALRGGTNNLDYGKILAQVMPIFRKFNSSIVRDVQFDLKATPKTSEGKLNFSDTNHFTTVDHDFTQIPLSFNFAVKSPDLPKFKGAYADGVFVIGGAAVPGRGVIPLGLGAGVNTTPADSKIDTQSSFTSAGLIGMRMAPTHHGVEGAQYGIISLALSTKSLEASTGLAASAIFGRIPTNQLVFDPKGSKTVDLPGEYPAITENAKYNFSDSSRGGLGGRTFRFTSDPGLSGTTLVRIVLSDSSGHDWVVYADSAQATNDVVLPKPPGVFEDRTFSEGLSTGERSTLNVQAVRLMDNPVAATGLISFKKFVEHNSTNADRFEEFTTGFSFMNYGRPGVEWLAPAEDGEALVAGSSMKLKVENFKVGVDGFVRVTFDNGSSQCTAVDGKTDTSNGKGEIAVSLPVGCTGSNVTMTATLHDASDELPITPAVSKSIRANIN